MTIQEAWDCLQSYLHTDQYDIEGMSEADWDIYQHAKDLLDNHMQIIVATWASAMCKPQVLYIK